LGGDYQAQWLPWLGHVIDARREFIDLLERMPRSEDHWKKRPAHLHLPRQIHSIHDTGKPNVGEDHGDLSAADEHSCKRCFRAFALDYVEFAVFEQCRREARAVRRRPQRSALLDVPLGLPPYSHPVTRL
jgi:hypothetical protein